MNEDIMRKLGFGKHMDLIKQSKCPLCGKDVSIKDMRNDSDRKEFAISKMCTAC